MKPIQERLSILLADTYALYLKTQNYHWHVRGAHFKPMHLLFEEQYTELAEAVDTIAERLLTMGFSAPATFKEFIELKTLKDGDSSKSSNEMVKELAADNMQLVKDLNQAIRIAQDDADEGSVAMLSERIAAHEKAAWMLRASEAV